MNAPAAESDRMLGTLQLFRGDNDDKFINIEMTVADVASCSEAGSLLSAGDESSPSCLVFRKCALVTDGADENLCVWKCLCNGRLLCGINIIQNFDSQSWKLCELQ